MSDISDMLDDGDEILVEEESTRGGSYGQDQRAFMTRLLAATTPRGELEEMIRGGFNPEVFQPHYQKVIEFTLGHFRETRSLPDYSQVRNHFPGAIDLVSAEDQMVYLSDHYSLLGLFRATADSHFIIQLREGHDAAAQAYNDDELSNDEVWARVEESHRRLALLKAAANHRSATLAELIPEVVSYFNEASTGSNFGVVIPFPFLNSTLRGWRHSNVYTVVARTGVGKTWFVLMAAGSAATGNPYLFSNARTLGHDEPTREQKKAWQKRVLIVSMEMPIEEIAMRLFALIAKFNYPELLMGNFDRPSDLKRFPEIAERLQQPGAPGERIRIVTASTPDEVAAEADLFKADLVIIDGFYLMSGPGDKRWERVQHNMQQIRLQSLMSTRPYLLASQLDAKEDRLSFSQSIGQDSTAVIMLNQRYDERNIKKLRMGTLKVRDGAVGEEYMYNWDFTNSRFNEEGPAYAGSGEEL